MRFFRHIFINLWRWYSGFEYWYHGTVLNGSVIQFIYLFVSDAPYNRLVSSWINELNWIVIDTKLFDFRFSTSVLRHEEAPANEILSFWGFSAVDLPPPRLGTEAPRDNPARSRSAALRRLSTCRRSSFFPSWYDLITFFEFILRRINSDGMAFGSSVISLLSTPSDAPALSSLPDFESAGEQSMFNCSDDARGQSTPISRLTEAFDSNRFISSDRLCLSLMSPSSSVGLFCIN